MTIAALIIEYRSAPRTAACVAALLRERACACIYVVDNSDDEGATRAEFNTLHGEDAAVEFVDSPSNLGFAAGVNLGLTSIRRVGGIKRVLIINNDAVVEPGAIAKLSCVLDLSSDALMSFPALMHSGRHLGDVHYHRWLALLGQRAMPGAFRVPRGCCLMLALERWDGPLFDESFFMYGEEVELGWRLRHQHGALIFVPDCRVIHEGSASAVNGSLFYEEHTAAAHWILSDRLARTNLERVLLVAVRAIMIVGRGCFRATRTLDTRPLRGLLLGWRRAKRVAARAELSARRRG